VHQQREIIMFEKLVDRANAFQEEHFAVLGIGVRGPVLVDDVWGVG
jgi:hypothetical protein